MIRKSKILMVGFNRRFAPHVVKMKELLSASKEPKSFVMTVNAGSIPADHWTQDPQVGGGRIIGEAYHFVDLIRYLAGNKIENAELDRMAATAGDTVSISLRFADGSIGTVHYFANGSRQFPKELLEVFCGGRVLQLDNFRRLKGYGYKNFKKMSSWGQDKGHAAEVAAFLDAVENGGEAPIPFDEIVKVTGTTIRLPSGRLPQ